MKKTLILALLLSLPILLKAQYVALVFPDSSRVVGYVLENYENDIYFRSQTEFLIVDKSAMVYVMNKDRKRFAPQEFFSDMTIEPDFSPGHYLERGANMQFQSMVLSGIGVFLSSVAVASETEGLAMMGFGLMTVGLVMNISGISHYRKAGRKMGARRIEAPLGASY